MTSWHFKTVIVKTNLFTKYGSSDVARSTTQKFSVKFLEFLEALKQHSAALVVILLSPSI